MKHLAFIILCIITVISGCSRKIEKEKSELSKEQVDYNKVNPLAVFYKNEDSLKVFETFSFYSEKKVNLKSNQHINEANKSIQFYVQVGLSDSYDEINQLKSEIVTLFPGERIEIKYDTPFYRIMIGPFKSKAEAKEIFSILERKKFSSIRIRTETTE